MIERSPTTPCLNVPLLRPVMGPGSNSAEDEEEEEEEEEDAVGVVLVVGVLGGICR